MDKTKNWLTQLDVQPIDIPAAFTLLTRLPLPVDHAKTGERAARAAWAYPFVGAVLGLIAGVIALSLAAFGVQTGIAAAVALGTLMLLTGALHEDGLSDCADGLGGGTTLKKRLEIMKDSRIGAFGAAALGVTLLARWSGYDAVITVDWLWAFVAVGTASAPANGFGDVRYAPVTARRARGYCWARHGSYCHYSNPAHRYSVCHQHWPLGSSYADCDDPCLSAAVLARMAAH